MAAEPQKPQQTNNKLTPRGNGRRCKQFKLMAAAQPKTAPSKTAHANVFPSIDHDTPADLESCHATIADLSPNLSCQRIAAEPALSLPVTRSGRSRTLDNA